MSAAHEKLTSQYRSPTLRLVALVVVLASQWVVFAPAAQRQQQSQAEFSSPTGSHETGLAARSGPAPPVRPSESTWNYPELWRLALALAVSSVLAAVRLRERFRHFSGLGLLRNSYCWLFVGFIALLSALSYSQLADQLKGLSGEVHPSLGSGFMSALMVTVGVGGGHALMGLARLAPRSHLAPVNPAYASRSRDMVTPNALLAFFYNGIYDHIADRMHTKARDLARHFDWRTVKKCTCELLETEMAVGRLPKDEGRELVDKIGSLLPASDPDEESSNKYRAIIWTTSECSYSQLESYLRQEARG
jgi:hypothetical protein